MPLHDWTRVKAGLFHHFHNMWLGYLVDALNDGRLPGGYFAVTDQRVGIHIPDISAAGPVRGTGDRGAPGPRPRADRTATLAIRRPVARRRVVVVDGDAVVAAIEIVSPGNKDGPKNAAEFAAKAADVIAAGVHLAVVDVLPPGPADPGGMHPLICRKLRVRNTAGEPPPDRPISLVGYDASRPVEAYLSYTGVGQPLPPVPLFLHGEVYVDLPLEETYTTGYTRLPAAIKARLG